MPLSTSHQIPGSNNPESPVDESDDNRPPGVPRWLLAAFCLLVAIVTIGLGYVVQGRFRRERHAIENGLRTVAELKLSQLIAWQRERLADAAVVARMPGLAESITQLAAASGTAESRMEEIDRYLNFMRRAYSYREIHLLDQSLRPVRNYPAERTWDGVLSPQVAEALRQGNFDSSRPEPPLIEDLHRDEAGVICMHFLVRVRSATGELAGAVLLTSEAEPDLYPLLQSWPVDSATAETLLIRREGDSLLCLSPLRHRSGAALQLRLPVTQPDLLAVNALRAGRDGLARGLDYRGMPAVGVALSVPGTAWVMISKIDKSEAYAQAWTELWQLSAVLFLVLLILGLFARAWLQVRQRAQIKRSLESERKRRVAAERLALVMRHANDVILLIDDAMRIVDANERAISVYGYSLEEFRQLTVRGLRAPTTNAELEQQFAAAHVDQGFTFETMHRRKDSTEFAVEVSSRPVSVAGVRHVLSIVRDITQRKAHEREIEREIERLSRLYLVISEVNQALVRAKARDELLDRICEVLVQRGGFRIAWVGWFNAETRSIDRVAVAGDTTGYTDGIRIAADPGLPEGRGPSGTAFHENRVYVCNDFFADPNTVPWRERAIRAGFNSTIALPLQQEKEVLGLLTVYAVQRDFFGSREIELLQETAGNISFALGVFAQERRRQAAEAALQASEARLQFLMSSTPAIIYSLRAGGDFATTFISPNLREVLGYDPDAVIAHPGFWVARLHPDDRAAALAETVDLESKTRISREYRFRHADGSWRWMSDEMRVARDAGGCALELVGYWLDITERKAAEMALKAREEIFSTIVEQAADAIALIEVTSGRFIEFNRAAHEGLGYTTEEFAALGLTDIQAQHSEADIRRNIELIRQGGSATFESLHRHRNGGLRDVRVSARLLHLQGRDCIAAVWSDITAAKRAETELRKLSLAVEQSPATIVITDLTGAIEYVNPRFTELTGYTAAEVIGKNPRLLKSGLTAPAVYEELWHEITHGRVWRGEIINRKKNGDTFVELCIVTPVTDAQGRTTQYVALKEDITHRLANEEKLRQLSRTIEQAPLSVAITDLAGVIQYVNPAFLAVTGYTREEVLGQNPRVLKSNLTAPATYVDMWRTLTRGEVWRGELINRKKNGDTYHERVVIAPVADEGGKITHYVALKDDITARMRTEAALRETQERYRLIAENTSDAIWLYDLKQERFVYSSPSVFRLLGYRPEDLLGLGMSALLTAESAGYLARALPERLARFAGGDLGARTQVDAIDHLHRDRHVVATEVSSTLLTDSDGRVTQILGVTRDVTERKRADEQLREREQRFRELFELETDAILVFEMDTGQIVQANPAAAQTYGYTVEQLVAMRTDEISAEPEATIELRQELINRADRTEFVPLRWHRRSDGARFPVEISQRIFRRTGRVLGVAVIRDVTVQHEAREQLQRFNTELEAKVRLRTEELSARNREIEALLESIPDMVLRFHRDGRMLNCQHAKGDTPLATPVLSPTSEAPAPEMSALRAAAVALGGRALEANATVAEEAKLDLGAGVLIVELRAAPIGAEEFVVFARDITARRRLEDALQESQERLSLAARAGNVGIWDYDVVRGRLGWDPQMFRLYGIGPDQFTDAYAIWQNGLHPDDRQRGTEEFQAALKGEKDFDTEFRVLWPDGSIHYIRAMGLVQRDAAGRPQHMVGTNWDITGEKESAAALRRSESILQQMFQATPMGFLLVDNRTDAILHFNQRFCEIWGIPHLAGAIRRGELKNNEIIPHCLPVLADVPAFAASCAGLQDEANRVVVEDEIPFIGGRTVRRFTTQIRDAEDRYYGRFYIFEDITAQKRLEREIAANLEKERQISEMKTRFISVTSHEFRTPMAAAMGSVDLLANHLDRLAPSKRQELLSRITASLHRMTDMLDEVLLLNRIDANRIEVNLVPVNLRQQLHTFIDEIRIGDREAHLFDFQAGGETESFATDLNLLHHICSNLLSNAVRYSPANSTITVRLTGVPEYVTLSVTDQGIGIPEKDRARIFEPFERGSNVGNIKGTGLGLNIVKRMTEMLGGAIAVQSVAPAGSCFTLTFPRLTQPHPCS